jgi:hypothetical protein
LGPPLADRLDGGGDIDHWAPAANSRSANPPSGSVVTVGLMVVLVVMRLYQRQTKDLMCGPEAQFLDDGEPSVLRGACDCAEPVALGCKRNER